MNKVKKLAELACTTITNHWKPSTANISLLGLLWFGTGLVYGVNYDNTNKEVITIHSTDCTEFSAGDPVARVFYAKGDVVITLFSEVEPLKSGGLIGRDSIVEVGSDGFVALLMPGLGEIYLQPLTAADFSCNDNKMNQVSYSIATPYKMGAVRG